ncbi:MAG: SDR family oxidoreductase [Methylobacter sp.]|uniref:dTDP-4-dehydrorhamnose reductase family protein n=1 Tax=Methylobacter sp. TaxID=2051955 RepID=UPI00258E6634|nr:SDR family oxidoreductase [Methylobacter sp.]MCL7420132.1 SDR family oxidoreductase [Methylobacter sp.]
MKKVVVLGSAGMAGHIMTEYLQATGEYHVLGVAREHGRYIDKKLDVLDFSGLQDYLSEVKPDRVINCIGVLVSQSANDLSTAIQINSYLPHFLSRLGTELGFKLVHISTDCVFSGKDGQYHEGAFRDGNDNYARTKALGEVINDHDLTIRTSIIGPELKRNGTGLLDWFFKQQGEIKGYSRAYWSGVTTLELAKATHELIRQNLTGLYQLCPDEKISKYELLRLFAQVWNQDISVQPYENYMVDKSLVCTRTDFNYRKPAYEAMLIELRDWMSAHPDYYSHYRLS